MRDEQVMHLLRVLQRPSCKIWCLNIGETYKVDMETWEKFAEGLKDTNVTHLYISEHTITTELKDQVRATIRDNRKKHTLHSDPSNLDTVRSRWRLVRSHSRVVFLCWFVSHSVLVLVPNRLFKRPTVGGTLSTPSPCVRISRREDTTTS